MDKRNWAQIKADRRAARERNREHGTRILIAAGVAFSVLDNGWHLRITHGEEHINYTPGSDTWRISGESRASSDLHRGVHSLIHYLATGRL